MWEIDVKKASCEMHVLIRMTPYTSFSTKEFFSMRFSIPNLVTVLWYVLFTDFKQQNKCTSEYIKSTCV